MMGYRVLIEPEARQDIFDAYSWYEEQRKELGREFLDCLDEVFERLGRSPEIHAITYKQVRQTLVRRFPYLVCYLIEQTDVSIVAVFHASRDPESWKKRIH